jgi:hypothetical protein
MSRFDYDAPAELFTGRSTRGSRPMRYHRFDSGAEAVRFAIETLTNEQLLAAVLKINETRYRHVEIRTFYDASAYPLARKNTAKEPASKGKDAVVQKPAAKAKTVGKTDKKAKKAA